MLNRCNILALVGGGKNPKYAPNKVVLWDDNQVKIISEMRFTSYIKNVKLKKEKYFINLYLYIFFLFYIFNINLIV